MAELDAKMSGNVDLTNSTSLLMAGSVYYHHGVSWHEPLQGNQDLQNYAGINGISQFIDLLHLYQLCVFQNFDAALRTLHQSESLEW